MAKVKVKMLETISGMVDGNEYPKRGDVIEVDEVVADDLCERPVGHKLAERVETARRGKRETATAGPVETAVEK